MAAVSFTTPLKSCNRGISDSFACLIYQNRSQGNTCFHDKFEQNKKLTPKQGSQIAIRQLPPTPKL